MRRMVMGGIGGLVLFAAACSTGGDPTLILPTRVELDQVQTQTAVVQAAPVLIPTASPASPAPSQLPIERTAEADSVARLEFWEAVSGTITPESPARWVFTGEAGDSIRLRALADGFELGLTLADSAGQIIASGNALEVEIPADGDYTVLVEAATTGPYELGLSYTDRPNPNDRLAQVPAVVGVPSPIPAYVQRGDYRGSLPDDAAIGGEFTGGADTSHIYTFQGEAGAFAQIEVLRAYGALDPLVIVYSPEGDPLAMDDDSAGDGGALLRNLRLPVDGLYSVEINGGTAAGGYGARLLLYDAFAPVTPTLIFVPTATPTPIPPTPTYAPALMGQRLDDHTPIIGRIAGPDDVAIFSLSAQAGETFSLAVIQAENSSLRVRVEITNPEGVIVANTESDPRDPLGEALIPAFRAEVTGVFQVFVTSVDGSTGEYILSYGSGSTRQEIERGLLPPDQPIQASIDRRGLRDQWRLTLKTGDVITAAATIIEGSTLDPILEFVSITPGGEETILAIDDNNGGGVNAFLNNLRIRADGEYVLRVKAAGAASTGGYTLVWRYLSLGPTPTPQPGVARVLSADGTVASQEYAFFPFQGRTGQVIRVRVTADDGSPFDPVAALLDPSGAVVAEADDTEGFNPVLTLTLPAEGTYTVRVNGYIEGGAFTVVVEELF